MQNKISNKVKLTLLLLSMLTVMSNAAIVTSLPHLGDHFKHIANIDLLSRFMITLPSLAIAILAPIIGIIIYKTSVVKSASIGLIIFAIAGSAGLYLSDIYNLLLSRVFLGIAIAILMIVGTTLIGSYFEGQNRHKFMGLQSAFISIGGIFFITSGGILSDIDWRFPFGIYLIGLLILPFVLLFLKEPTMDQNNENENIKITGNLKIIYFLAFLMMMVFYTLPTQMPFLMINHFGASGTLTGFLISSAMASNAIGALAFSKLKKQFDYKTIYMIGFLILAVGFIAIGNINNVYLFFVTSPIMGFGGGIIMTTTTAWMLHIAHHTKRTKASGYLTSSIYAGQFSSPLVFHPFVDAFGLQNFFIGLGFAIIFVLGVVLISRLVGHIKSWKIS